MTCKVNDSEIRSTPDIGWKWYAMDSLRKMLFKIIQRYQINFSMMVTFSISFKLR